MSNPSFDPDPEVRPDALWLTKWLAGRDLGAQVPINYLTRPTISLATACFSEKIYDDPRAVKCISNLLLAHFERIIVDLYWDSSSLQFNFCPVSFAPISAGSAAISSTTASTASPVSASLSSVSIGTEDAIPIDVDSLQQKRQVQTSASSFVGTMTTSVNVTSITSSLPVISTTASNATLYRAGPYQCSKSLDLPWFIRLLQNFLQATEDTLNANVIILEINMHGAASQDDPESAAPVPTTLPGDSLLVGAQFSSILRSFMYTTDDLQSDRSNLNDTWFKVPQDRTPISEYMDIISMNDGDIRTTSGWPNVAYLLLEKAIRLLITWGAVDPQMQGYNFSNDLVIFQTGALSTMIDIESSSDGNVTTGCLYDQSKSSPFQLNASWALPSPSGDEIAATSSSSLQSLLYLNSNLTLCGISPVTNQTILRQTADQLPVPYLNVSKSSVWAWAPEEPRNFSGSQSQASASSSSAASGAQNEDEELYRCAFLDLRPPYNGRWRVEHCNERHHVACQSKISPYIFHISDSPVPFSAGPDACSSNSTFAVPRTGLESNYLLQYLLTLPTSIIDSTSGSGDGHSGVWVNFNSLDVQGCWTSKGPNATCPYSVPHGGVRERIVLVPVIASMVVLALAAITIFVKCAGNRRTSKRSKRGEGGWDYEGVPS